MQFKELKIGQKFFDPECGDCFEKVSETEALMIDGTFAGEAADHAPDKFDPDDVVEVDDPDQE